jgi:hypothetical protein
MADVFISYSRVDQDFVRVLHQALAQSQCDAWVDWEDIPLSADWWKEIQAGIDAANTFVFVISPDSLKSEVCRQEIDYAAASHKRMMPIVWRDEFDRAVVPPALGKHNWLFFRQTDNFDQAFQALVKTLDTDLDYVKLHTRLLVRSREWEASQKMADYLLRGKDLESAETWLAQSTGKSPGPTALHRDYVYRSRRAETTRQRQQQRRLQIFGASVSGLALLALGAAGLAFQQRQRAIVQEQLAYQQSKLAFANQLAVAAQTTVQSQLRQNQLLQDLSAEMASPAPEVQETTLAFGLASLPDDLAALLRQERPRLITFSPYNTYVAIVNEAYDLRVWHVPSQRQVLVWGVESNIADVGFSPDETLLTVATRDSVLHIWRTDVDAYTAKTALEGHTQRLTDTAFSPDGGLFATASEDGTVRLWNLSDILNENKRQAMLLRHPAPVQSVTFSPDGQHVLTGDDQALRVWSMAGQPTLCLSHNEPLRLVMFNNDGTQVGSVSSETLVRVWPWPQLLEESLTLAEARPSCG